MSALLSKKQAAIENAFRKKRSWSCLLRFLEELKRPGFGVILPVCGGVLANRAERPMRVGEGEAGERIRRIRYGMHLTLPPG